MNDQVAILQLMQTKGVGSRTLGRALTKLFQEGRAVEDLVAASVDELTHFGLKPAAAQALAANRDQAEKVSGELERQGVQMLVRGTPFYPERLRRILGDQAPPVLFRAGNPALLKRRAAAFCGARDVSEEGMQLTQAIAQRLAEQGVNIVSGHANGVDLTAHAAALISGGSTALVLAEGILRFQAKRALDGLLGDDNYVVVSEFPPRLSWSVGNAMQRNATVCGLSDVVLVIEAGLTGGTFAAGQTALKLRQPLFVLAVQKPPASAMGNATLLRLGGQPLVCEPGSMPDLSGVWQALEPNSALNTAQPSAVAQRGLFDTTNR